MTGTRREMMRRITFRPYTSGPSFTLTTWDTGRSGYGGKWLVGYKLTMRQGGKSTVLFQGEDFGSSPMHAIDSDETCRGIMAFLTLRPGDTDADYFEDYTQQQLDYCSEHAEALDSAVRDRFGDE